MLRPSLKAGKAPIDTNRLHHDNNRQDEERHPVIAVLQLNF